MLGGALHGISRLLILWPPDCSAAWLRERIDKTSAAVTAGNKIVRAVAGMPCMCCGGADFGPWALGTAVLQARLCGAMPITYQLVSHKLSAAAGVPWPCCDSLGPTGPRNAVLQARCQVRYRGQCWLIKCSANVPAVLGLGQEEASPRSPAKKAGMRATRSVACYLW